MIRFSRKMTRENIQEMRPDTTRVPGKEYSRINVEYYSHYTRKDAADSEHCETKDDELKTESLLWYSVFVGCVSLEYDLYSKRGSYFG